MGYNYLAGRAGDAVNAALAAVDCNFKLLLSWLAGLLWMFHTLVLTTGNAASNARYTAQPDCFTNDEIAYCRACQAISSNLPMIPPYVVIKPIMIESK
jgi:hypothetical protein